MVLANSAREKLTRGELSLGLAIKIARGVEIAKVMKTAGYDWLFLDLEHGAMSIETASQIAIAALDVGIAPLVRVPRGEYSIAQRLLDTGALGIVVPHVDSATEAREVVDKLKYHPVGHRTVASVIPQFDYKPVKISELIETINRETLVVVMIESPEAVAAVDEIAAVPGVDVLLIGCGDLSNELGIPGNQNDPKLLEAIKRVGEACAKHNKWFGFGGVGDTDLAARFIGIGARFILAAADIPMLIEASSRRAETLRNALRAISE